MTARWTAFVFLAAWAGATLLLSGRRWFSRPSMRERLRPYVITGPAGADASSSRAGVLSVESFREVVGPLSQSLGSQLARLFGVSEELAVRLERVHSDLDVAAFRLRQVGWATWAFAGGVVAEITAQPPPIVAPLLLIGLPLLAFLVLEQQLAQQSDARKRRVFLELPVVAEQLAMLLAAGYSLGAGLHRIADRGSGVVAEDVRRVCARITQGLGETQALQEWAAVAASPAVDRLVAVLSLNRQSTDLSRLLSEEARSLRADAQREVTATIDKRAQQVWIPVTVATLLPGALFLAIPFTSALRLFSGS